MPRSGPSTLYTYTDEFTQTAVRLSHQPGMQVKTVAAALEIHPFMLSTWRKDVRDGIIWRARGVSNPATQDRRLTHEMVRLFARHHETTTASGGASAWR